MAARTAIARSDFKYIISLKNTLFPQVFERPTYLPMQRQTGLRPAEARTSRAISRGGDEPADFLVADGLARPHALVGKKHPFEATPLNRPDLAHGDAGIAASADEPR